MGKMDLVKTWAPLFGTLGLSLKVLVAKAALTVAAVYTAIGNTARADQIVLLAGALGLDLHVANAMGTSFAVAALAGVCFKLRNVYVAWKESKTTVDTKNLPQN